MRLLALFAVVALAEMVTFFVVESRIGLLWALGLAVATAVVGSMAVRRAGLAVFADIQHKVGAAQLPGRELTHAAAVLVAGAFLISPGFITDLLGFLLLVPTIRDLAHRMVTARLAGRVTVLSAGSIVRPAAAPDAAPDVIDVESWE